MDRPVVVVGAGPAGMMLAYQLASNGIAVHVLERHPDFRREFRGEIIQQSMLKPLDALGILPALVKSGAARPGSAWRQYVGLRHFVRIGGGSGSGLPDAMFVDQPAFLELMHKECSRYPHYRLDFSATALRAIRENGRAVALEVRRPGGEQQRIDGEVFVACSGRNTALRGEAGLKATAFQAPLYVLWFRFDLAGFPEAMPSGLEVHLFGRGRAAVLIPSTGGRAMVAFVEPEDFGPWVKDLSELRRRLLERMPPAMRPVVEQQLDGGTPRQILKVAVDRLACWSAPGILFLGDAAHTMSPIGGQGLNLAMRDSLVAANHFIDAVRAGAPIDGDVFRRIEEERRPEIEAIQKIQLRLGRLVRAPRPVLHVANQVIGTVMRLKKGGSMIAGVTCVEMKHPVPIPA